MKNLGQNGRLSYDSRTSVKKGHNFSYVNRSPIVERTRNLVLLTKIQNDRNLLQRTQSSLHMTSVIYLDTAVHATNDQCQILQIPALKASSETYSKGNKAGQSLQKFESKRDNLACKTSRTKE